MTKKEYYECVSNCDINKDRVLALEKIYGFKVDGTLANVISYAGNINFFDEERRALSFEEIVNADEKYGVSFVGKKMIPVIDAYDNDFIVFSFDEGKWAKVNLADLVLYKKRDLLVDVL